MGMNMASTNASNLMGAVNTGDSEYTKEEREMPEPVSLFEKKEVKEEKQDSEDIDYPKFCPNCGSATKGGNFCGSCGNKLR